MPETLAESKTRPPELVPSKTKPIFPTTNVEAVDAAGTVTFLPVDDFDGLAAGTDRAEQTVAQPSAVPPLPEADEGEFEFAIQARKNAVVDTAAGRLAVIWFSRVCSFSAGSRCDFAGRCGTFERRLLLTGNCLIRFVKVAESHAGPGCSGRTSLWNPSLTDCLSGRFCCPHRSRNVSIGTS